MGSRRLVLPGRSWARTKLEVVSFIESVVVEAWQTKGVCSASPFTSNLVSYNPLFVV